MQRLLQEAIRRARRNCYKHVATVRAKVSLIVLDFGLDSWDFVSEMDLLKN